MAGAADILAWAEAAGLTSPLGFGLAYTAAVVCLLPVWWLSMVAGVVFGPVTGTVIVFTASSLGGLITCTMARRMGRRAVERWASRRPSVAAVAAALQGAGIGTVLLLRLSPVVPYAVMNVILGVSAVPLRAIALGSVGMLPVVSMYVGTGAAAGNVMAVLSGNVSPRGSGSLALTVVGLLATVVVVVTVTRRATQALAPRLVPRDPPPVD